MAMPAGQSFHWKGREATGLSNGFVELIALTGGGHLASFRFLEATGRPAYNVIWEPTWPTYDPVPSPPEEVLQKYGPRGINQFIAAYTGHSLCLDYFGEASAAQIDAGLGLHGEAPVARWNVSEQDPLGGPACRWDIKLPAARLAFERNIRLKDNESVAYVEETVRNENLGQEHAFDWVQHATFGPPLVKEGESKVIASAKRGITWPLGYEDASLLANDREFAWPYAPCEAAEGNADLQQPFSTKGRGFVAGVQLDPGRTVEYIVAVNWSLRLGMGYCFRRQDFPWMTVWEENCARKGVPWNGTAQARGMEFGTAPFPLGRDANLSRGPLFDTPTCCVLSPGAERTARYLLFLFEISPGVNSIEDVAVQADTIVLLDEHSHPVIAVAAQGCEQFLSSSEARKD
jgi:hypothetical protein